MEMDRHLKRNSHKSLAAFMPGFRGNKPQQGPHRIPTPPPYRFNDGGGTQTRLVVPTPGWEEPLRRRGSRTAAATNVAAGGAAPKRGPQRATDTLNPLRSGESSRDWVTPGWGDVARPLDRLPPRSSPHSPSRTPGKKSADAGVC